MPQFVGTVEMVATREGICHVLRIDISFDVADFCPLSNESFQC